MARERLRIALLLFMLAMGAFIAARDESGASHYILGFSQMVVMSGLLALRLTK